MKRIIYIILFVLISNYALAESFSIKGKIIDLETKLSLAGATIKVEGTGLGAVADNQGNFKIKNLIGGKYKFIVSMIGYRSYHEEVIIDKNSDDFVFSLQNKGFETSEIVVSANKRVQAVQEVPISISVIDYQSSYNRNYSRIDEMLRLVPGVNLNQDNVNIRGSSGFAFGVGSRVLLLMDGFPMLSGDNGDMKFDAVPMLNVERIEVVKGAGSALYGSSALGGIINIITKDPSENLEINAKSFFGLYTPPRHNSWKWSEVSLTKKGFELMVGKKFGDFGTTMSLGIIDDDSYRQLDDSKRYYFLSKFNYNLSENNKVKLLLNYAFNDKADWLYWRSLDSALIPPANTDMSARIESQKFNANLEYEYIINSKNFLNLKSGIYMTDFKGISDIFDTNSRSSFANAINLELQYNSILTDYLFLTAGATFTRNNVSSKTYGNRNQTIYGGYAQIELKPIDELVVNFGARFDKEEVENINNQSEISPKFGVSYSLLPNLTFRASFGSGFRAPRTAERFANLVAGGFDLVPNLSLLSEQSVSYEIGGVYEFFFYSIPMSIDLALFRNDFDNLIEATFVTQNYAPVIQFVNLTKASIKGIEFNLKAMLLKNLGIETSLTLTDPQDEILKQTLKYRSNVLWYNRIFYNWNDFGFNVDYRFMSRAENIDEKLGLQVIDHDARVDAHIVDLNLNYNFEYLIGYKIISSIYAKNLFDYYYTEMTGNLAATRVIGLELKYNF